MKIFLILLMIAQNSFAQTLGNPGGGGPDDEMRTQSNRCRIHLSTLKEIENDLLILLNKKFVNFEIFVHQIYEIQHQELLKSFERIFETKNANCLVCTERSEEIKAIEAILKELNSSTAIECHQKSTIRETHIKALQSLLDLYEKK
jgi:hypothetical protein